jgi:hypothetical protein
MTIRRLTAYLPLAAVVGAGVHVAGAGFAHAPGGERAVPFLGTLAASLAFTLAAIFLAGAIGTLRPSIATKRSRVQGVASTLALAVAGTAVFAAIEALEGHLPLGGAMRALAASFPLAALVLAVSQRAALSMVRAGARFKAAAFASVAIAAPPFRLPTRRHRVLARHRYLATATRGRAPPVAF